MSVSRPTAPLRLVATSPDRGRRNDSDLVLALRDGHEWASAAIWDRYSDQVARFFARSLGRAADDVDDLTQEVFLRVFTRPEAIREPEALREFVMGVALRVLRNLFRYRWIRRIVRLSPDGQLPEVPAASGTDEAARHALRRCYRILDCLAVRERAAFVLRYLEEMTIDEVATCMAVSRSSAKRLINRAVAKVSEHVAQDTDLRSFFLESGGRVFGDR
jgi:RNA polymerase sigma-70 factor (ECF subfamily)